MKMKILISFAVIVGLSTEGLIVPSSVHAASIKSKKSNSTRKKDHPDWVRIEAELKKEKFKSGFIRFLKSHFDPPNHESVLNLNILGFLTPVDHNDQVTDDAVDETRGFMNVHKRSLALAKKKFKVDPEYVSALLYLETRHGKLRGKFHVPSVFASLIGARNKTVQANLILEAKKRMNADSPPLKEVLKKVREKIKSKSKWAVSELRVVEKVYKRDPVFAKEWVGSFAGAFGISQFLPSSFSRWAYTDRKKGKKIDLPDLDDPHDAILSVGNYLSKNGWGKSRKKKEKALYHYNNSKDYVEAILSIGDQAMGREPMVTQNEKLELTPQPLPSPPKSEN